MYERLLELDNIHLNFSSSSLVFLNITLAIIMVGVALGVRLKRFRNIIKSPKPLIIGLISQIILLPAFTFLLTIILPIPQSVGLGMLLVASCPGGNISNFMSSYARGNVELSVSMTMFSTLGASIFTPLNFMIWGNLFLKYSAQKMHETIPFIHIDFWQMFQTIVIILVLPIIIGLLITRFWPKQALKSAKHVKNISAFIFLGLVIYLIYKNVQYLFNVLEIIFLIVLIHNLLAIAIGYTFARINKLSRRDRRTIAIETGIQNSGLALVLIFNPHLFNGIGGMATIAAWWGVWHIISGLSIAFYWSKTKLYG